MMTENHSQFPEEATQWAPPADPKGSPPRWLVMVPRIPARRCPFCCREAGDPVVPSSLAVHVQDWLLADPNIT